MKKSGKMLLLLTLVILLAAIASASEVSDNTTSTTSDTLEMKVADNIQQESQPNTVTNEKSLDNNKIQSITEDKNNKTLDKNINRQNTKEATASDWNTLVSAVDAASQATSDTTITLQNGNYTTSNTITWDNTNIVLTIDGNGQTIDGNEQQVFIITSGSSLVLKNITIQNAYEDYGGAIYNNGTLAIIDSTLQNNNATYHGGAIYNFYYNTTVTLTNTKLQNNNAPFGGAIFNDFRSSVTITNTTIQNNKASDCGGAIYNWGIVTVSNTTIQNNTANNGGAIYDVGYLTISNSSFVKNTVRNMGGAIFNIGNLTITNTTLQNNTSNNTGGAIRGNNLDNVTFTGNVFIDNHANNKETIDLNGLMGGEFTDNTYENTDIQLTEIKLTIKDNLFFYGDDIVLNYSIQLANPDNYKDFEAGINDITLYINDEKNITTKYENTTLSDLEPGNYTVYFTTCNQQSNTVSFTVTTITNWELLERAVRTAENITENITLTLDEGTYTNSGTITWNNTNIVLTIDGNGQTIDGNKQQVFIITSGSSLVLKNIIIENAYAEHRGGAIYNNHGTLKITNTTLQNNIAEYGGAIYSSGDTTVSNSTLQNNTATDGGAIYDYECTLKITNNTLLQNNTAQYGGAIHNERGTVTVNNSTLQNNTATDEGGVIDNRGTITITDSTLQNNNANYGGTISTYHGTITVNNSTLQNNNATKIGGAIFNSYGTLRVTNTTLQNNTSNKGGAIYSSGDTTVINSTLQNNNVNKSGGAIYNFRSTLTITNTTIQNNTAEYGGAIYSEDKTIVTITNTTIQNNTATQYGGAIYNNKTCNVTITNTTIQNNTASYGGAINNGGTLTVTNNTLLQNNTAGNGGAIYNEEGTVTVTQSILQNNTASYGGAINNYNGTITITNTTIQNNTATQFGGAIYNRGNLTITNYSILQNNIAYPIGGAIFNEGTLTITNSILQNNKATRYGGAINNYNGTITITNTTLQNNTAEYGGAINNDEEGIVTITNTTIQNNNATSRGAINNGGGHVIITNTTLQNNTSQYGGAISNGGTLTVSNSLLQNNQAKYTGGAITNGGTLTVTNTTIQNNTAIRGGAIYNSGGSVTFTGNAFIDNHAANMETIDLNGLTDGKFRDNTYENTDINLTEIKSNINDNIIHYGEDIILNYSIQLANPDYYKDFEDGINDITLYINNEKNITTKYENTTLSKLQPGKYTVYFTTCNQQSNTVTFNVTKQDITITYDPIEDTKYKDNITITGRITDVNGKGLGNINALIHINNKQYKAKTDRTGAFTFTTTATTIGTNNITISYAGNNNYNGYECNTTFQVEKQDITIIYDTIEDTKYKDNVTINGRIVDVNGNALGNINALIHINDKQYKAKTDSTGAFTFTIATTTVGTNNVTLSYGGNANYNSYEINTTFQVEKQDITIIYDTIEDTKYKDNVTINGRIVDVNGKGLGNINALIHINDKLYKAKTDSTGAFTFTIATTTVGTNNVTISYGGNNYYNSYEINTTFNVEKQDIIITYDPIEDVVSGENVNITGSVSDVNGNGLGNINALIRVNGKLFKAKTDKTGAFTFTTTATTPGTNNVTLSYGGNVNYNSYETSTTFNVIATE